MPPVSPIYKQLSPEENFSLDDSSEPLQSPSRHQASTIILSFTTAIFAILSLYLTNLAQQPLHRNHKLTNCIERRCLSNRIRYRMG